MGDLALACTGTAGSTVSFSLTVFLPAPITNRLNADGTAAGAALTLNGAPGPPGQVTSNSITFSGIQVQVPASGGVNVNIANLRVNVNLLGVQSAASVRAQLSVNPPSSLSLAPGAATVAVTNPGLLASYSGTGISCVGSPAPPTVSMSDLFAAGTSLVSTRLTEGFATAFQPRDSTSDTGTRFLVRYSGLPAGARLFVPDLVAGSSAARPTAGGDLGLPQSAGQYFPGSNGLLLARAAYTDANGAGGALVPFVSAPGPAPVTLDAASEIPVVNGSALVVYEVVSADPLQQESAQFPTFLAIPSASAGAVAQESVSLAPVSNAAYATATDPIPRFAAVAPASDCAVEDDCGAAYFPKFAVVAQPIQFSAAAGGGPPEFPGYIAVQNQGGGVVTWTATVAYQSESGWLTLSTSSGVNGAGIQVFASPRSLAPGTYQATITIDAGSLGRKTVPVAFTVTPAPAPVVVVASVVNAATFVAGPLAPGSLATLLGTHLSGRSVSVTFDGIAATLLYTSSTQINLQIPAQLAGRSSSQMVVTVDGASGAPQAVPLAELSPGIFGILNQDNTVNTAASPAGPGSVLQVFATGLPASGNVDVVIAGRDTLAPVFPAPGLVGVEQFNVPVPAGLAGMRTALAACVYGSGGQRVCSPPVPLSLGQ